MSLVDWIKLLRLRCPTPSTSSNGISVFKWTHLYDWLLRSSCSEHGPSFCHFIVSWRSISYLVIIVRLFWGALIFRISKRRGTFNHIASICGFLQGENWYWNISSRIYDLLFFFTHAHNTRHCIYEISINWSSSWMALLLFILLLILSWWSVVLLTHLKWLLVFSKTII